MSRKEMKEPEIERFVDFAKELSALSEKHGISFGSQHLFGSSSQRRKSCEFNQNKNLSQVEQLS